MQTRLICAAFLPDTEQTQTLMDKTAKGKKPHELPPTNLEYSSSDATFKRPTVNNNQDAVTRLKCLQQLVCLSLVNTHSC